MKGTCLFVRWPTNEQSARFSSPFHTIIPLRWEITVTQSWVCFDFYMFFSTCICLSKHVGFEQMAAFEELMEAVSLPSIRATLLAGWPHTGLVFALPVSSLFGPPICSLIVRSRCESLNRRPWPGAQIMTRCVSLAAEAKLPLGAELPWK